MERVHLRLVHIGFRGAPCSWFHNSRNLLFPLRRVRETVAITTTNNANASKAKNLAR